MFEDKTINAHIYGFKIYFKCSYIFSVKETTQTGFSKNFDDSVNKKITGLVKASNS